MTTLWLWSFISILIVSRSSDWFTTLINTKLVASLGRHPDVPLLLINPPNDVNYAAHVLFMITSPLINHILGKSSCITHNNLIYPEIINFDYCDQMWHNLGCWIRIATIGVVKENNPLTTVKTFNWFSICRFLPRACNIMGNFLCTWIWIIPCSQVTSICLILDTSNVVVHINGLLEEWCCCSNCSKIGIIGPW